MLAVSQWFDRPNHHLQLRRNFNNAAFGPSIVISFFTRESCTSDFVLFFCLSLFRYDVCVRKAEGYCCIQYEVIFGVCSWYQLVSRQRYIVVSCKLCDVTSTGITTNTPNDFTLDQQGTKSMVGAECTNAFDFIMIPGWYLLFSSL